MKITKRQLHRIIKEELTKEARGYGNETEIDDDTIGRANQEFEMPELVDSWAKKIHSWIESQWSADSDFSSVRAERPAIVAALKKVANDLGEWHTSPEPYSESKKKRKLFRENRQIVTDYLFGLPEDELIQVAAEYLGEEPGQINYDYAIEWVDGMSEEEISEVSLEMGI